MRKFAGIVESTVAPPTNCIWLRGKDAMYFTNGKWVSLVTGEGSEGILELETKVDALDKEIGNVKDAIRILEAKDVVELEIGNSDEVKKNNLAKLQEVQSIDHLFFADIDYGYGAARWLPSTGGEAFIITSKGISVTYIISPDGSVTKKEEIDIPKLKKDIDNKVTIIDDVVLDLLSYGVSWKPEVADPALTRVGNMTYHKTLPIQNNMKGCIAQMKGDVKIIYYLNETDWRFRTPQDVRSHTLKDQVISFDGNEHTITNDVFSTLQYEYQYIKVNDIICQVTSINTETKTAGITPEKALAAGSYDVELGAVLNGYDGEVMVEVPEFWIKSWDTDTRREVRISPSKIDDTWEHQPRILISPYHDTILNTIPTGMGYLSTLEKDSAISVCSIHNYCRGGDNNSLYDQYITTDRFRSLLGKPRTNISRNTMRDNCRKSGKEILSYLQYKRILYWLYIIEYANFNCKTSFTSELTSEGFRQGGLGDGVTTINSVYWNYYNKYNPLIFNGYTNEFGNGTNIKALTLVMPTTSNNESTSSITQYVPRWHGIENLFGHIWTVVDGIINNSASIVEDAKIYNEYYITDDPLLYNDNDYNNMKRIIGLNETNYIKEWNLGNTANIISRLAINTPTQYKCTYQWCDSQKGLKIFLFSGNATATNKATIGSYYSYGSIINKSNDFGFRSSCVIA